MKYLYLLKLSLILSVCSRGLKMLFEDNTNAFHSCIWCNNIGGQIVQISHVILGLNTELVRHKVIDIPQAKYCVCGCLTTSFLCSRDAGHGIGSAWRHVKVARVERYRLQCLCTGPAFCLLLGVSSGYVRPVTGQVTLQKTGPELSGTLFVPK